MAKATNFIQEVKVQLGKVAWPSKEELISSTIVVLVSTFLLGIFIGLCDLFFSNAVNVLISGVF